MFSVRFATILVLMMMMIPNVISDGSSSSSRDDKCGHLSAQWDKNSSWITDAQEQILYWTVKSQTQIPPACQCPSNGGLDDITRIQTPTTSFTICTGCLGNEKVATDVKFCTDSYIYSSSLRCRSPFGPCPGVTVYRCPCVLSNTDAPIVGAPAPETTAGAAPTTKATTVGIPTLPSVSDSFTIFYG